MSKLQNPSIYHCWSGWPVIRSASCAITTLGPNPPVCASMYQAADVKILTWVTLVKVDCVQMTWVRVDCGRHGSEEYLHSGRRRGDHQGWCSNSRPLGSSLIRLSQGSKDHLLRWGCVWEVVVCVKRYLSLLSSLSVLSIFSAFYGLSHLSVSSALFALSALARIMKLGGISNCEILWNVFKITKFGWNCAVYCQRSSMGSGRVDIWRDRCDRRSRKIFCELRKFLGKQRKMLYNSTPK